MCCVDFEFNRTEFGIVMFIIIGASSRILDECTAQV